MRIGIFEGKEAFNNHAILKVLTEQGPLKPWSIAKEIAAIERKKRKIAKIERTRKIYGNLIRSNGRLNDLTSKGYVQRLKNGFYAPTLKGILAVLVYEKSLPKISEFYSNILKVYAETFPSRVKVPFLDVEVDGERFKKAFEEFAENLRFKEGWQKLKDMVANFLKCGLDLDFISNDDLLNLILLKLELDEEKIEKWFKDSAFI